MLRISTTMSTPSKAVFLDRDGVINHTVFRRGAQRAPQDMQEWVWIEGVHDTLRELSARGYLLFVCTNQPDVVRGWQTREQVDEFHALIARELPVARVYACFHDNAAACACRKPQPGMLLQAGLEFAVDYTSSWMVGDRASDIAAGRAAGCRTVLFRGASSEATAEADHAVSGLRELLAIIR
jgi:D-glycero-D-manno-heptose 1,7-bisphosphate phosphatase